jgi:hypothetical protein
MNEEPKCYRIRRYFRSGRKRTIHSNVTLAVAQLHCSDKRTKSGGWFDGYDFQPGWYSQTGLTILQMGEIA